MEILILLVIFGVAVMLLPYILTGLILILGTLMVVVASIWMVLGTIWKKLTGG